MLKKLIRSDREHGDQENIWTVGDETTKGLRKLYDNNELHNLYPSPNIVRVIKLGGGGGNFGRLGRRDGWGQNFLQKT
jgi:hypothetical protein